MNEKTVAQIPWEALAAIRAEITPERQPREFTVSEYQEHFGLATHTQAYDELQAMCNMKPPRATRRGGKGTAKMEILYKLVEVDSNNLSK